MRRENLYTQIIYIILSCINATKMCNTAIERQLCELYKSVRFLKLRSLLKCTGRFKWEQSDMTYAHFKSNLKFRGSLRLYGLKSVMLCYFHSNIVLQWLLRGHFAILTYYFASKARIFIFRQFQPLQRPVEMSKVASLVQSFGGDPNSSPMILFPYKTI